MQSGIYAPCACGSGKKIKFCCYAALREATTQAEEGELYVRFPLKVCVAAPVDNETGMNTVVIARAVSEDVYALAFYLLDIWCLGLKNVEFLKRASYDQVSYYLQGMINCYGGFQPISYEQARGLVLGSIDYAIDLGLEAWTN